MGTEQRDPEICNSSIQENYPDSTEGNICRSQIGRKMKHHSSRTCLTSQRMSPQGGGWWCSSLGLLLLKPAPEVTKRSNKATQLPALSGGVVCHVHATAHIS